MPTRPTRLIMDTDGGIDDALALILALRSPEVEVVGVSTVSGNVRVEQAAINVLRVIELFDHRDVWVAQGLANPLIRDPVRATSFHGMDGLGDSNLPQPRMRARKESAIDLIIEELTKEKDHGLTIICIGPLTNIAAVITNSPSISGRIGELLIMGGAFGLSKYGHGNVTPVAEFNIYSDPEAAKIVFESGVSLKCVGLDETMTPGAQLSPREYATIKRSETDHAQFAAKILAKAMGREKRFALHDPMAIAMKVRPSLFKFQDYHVNVETKGEYTTGMTVSDRRDRPSKELQGQRIAVCKDAKAAAFKQVFLRRLMSR